MSIETIIRHERRRYVRFFADARATLKKDRPDVESEATAKGDGYFQYVEKILPMGSLIRVFPLGMASENGGDWDALVEQETNFWTFFPVASALKQQLIRKVAHCAVPEHARKTPLFRAGIPDGDTRKVSSWWLWDGEKEWLVGSITKEKRRLPIRSSWNDTLLIERLEQGRLPEKDPW
jgi:hypothetical protein